MALEDHLGDIILRFKETLDCKESILSCFCKYGVQLEGWLKGELLYFLDAETRVGRISRFDREVSPAGMGRKRVDFKVGMSTSSSASEAWIELKHWLIGYQKGYPYNAQFYFGDPSSVGIKPDAEKLVEIPHGSKFFLILATANPSIDDWSKGVSKFNRSRGASPCAPTVPGAGTGAGPYGTGEHRPSPRLRPASRGPAPTKKLQAAVCVLAMTHIGHLDAAIRSSLRSKSKVKSKKSTGTIGLLWFGFLLFTFYFLLVSYPP